MPMPARRVRDKIARCRAPSGCRGTPERSARQPVSHSAVYFALENENMKMRTATLDAAAAVNLLKHARSVCDQLNPLGTPMTMAELQQRAQIVDSVIRARAKLQLLRNRAIALESAVERFKARKAGNAA
jgi:hypothetical protein